MAGAILPRPRSRTIDGGTDVTRHYPTQSQTVRSIGRARAAAVELAIVAAIALVAGASALAAETVRTVGSLALYLGVVPAEMLQGHPGEHPEKKMHRGASDLRRQRHVLIAVFDAASGARIEDAVVTAKVGEPGLAKMEKRLEAMPIGGAASYGNFFSMPGGTYEIDVRVLVPSTGKVIDTRFTYAVPR